MSVEVIKQVITEDYNRIFLLPSLDLLKKQFQKIICCIGKPTSYTCNIFDNNSTKGMGKALLEERKDKRYEFQSIGRKEDDKGGSIRLK